MICKVSNAEVWQFVKTVGWHGLLCEMFNIDSKHHEMYQHAYNRGMTSLYDDGGPLSLDETILHLACNIPDVEPFKTRAICQMRGFADAKKQREIGTVNNNRPHHVSKKLEKDLTVEVLQNIARESMGVLFDEIGKDIIFHHDQKHTGDGKYISVTMPFEKETELSIERYVEQHITPTMRVLSNNLHQRSENVIDTFDIAMPKAYQYCYRILINGMSAMFHIELTSAGHIIVMTVGIKKTGISVTVSDKP